MSETNSLKIFPESKRFYEARGKDTLRFLQGMCTTDLRRALEGARHSKAPAGTCFGYFLNLKGKALSPVLFCVYSEEQIQFSLPASSAESCVASLEKYVVADDVEFKEDTTLDCYQILESRDLHPNTAELEVPHQVPGALDRVFCVERIPQGLRLPRASISVSHEEWWVKKGETLPNAQKLSDDEYLARRIEAGVPEWGRDYSEESFLLEFPTQDSISYHKGCYLGQEVVARTTYRGHVTRAFCRFEGSDLKEDFIYAANEPEKAIGKITSATAHAGLGLLRVAALTPDTKLMQAAATAPGAVTLQKVLIPYEK